MGVYQLPLKKGPFSIFLFAYSEQSMF